MDRTQPFSAIASGSFPTSTRTGPDPVPEANAPCTVEYGLDVAEIGTLFLQSNVHLSHACAPHSTGAGRGVGSLQSSAQRSVEQAGICPHPYREPVFACASGLRATPVGCKSLHRGSLSPSDPKSKRVLKIRLGCTTVTALSCVGGTGGLAIGFHPPSGMKSLKALPFS